MDPRDGTDVSSPTGETSTLRTMHATQGRWLYNRFIAANQDKMEGYLKQAQEVAAILTDPQEKNSYLVTWLRSTSQTETIVKPLL